MGRIEKILACAAHVLLGLLIPCFPGAAWAQAYEPFSYSLGSPIAGLNGGTGWGGPWVGGNGVIVPGLTYTGLTVAGNALGPSGVFTQRPLAAPIPGTTGNCALLRVLMRSDVTGTPATQATLGNFPNGGGQVFTIGDLPVLDPGGGNWALQNAAGNVYSSVPVVANATTYLVGRIDFLAGNDRMRVWINPPVTPPSPTTTADIDVTNANLSQFSGVFWQTQQGQQVDEIRVDSSCTPPPPCVPPPTTTMVAWYPFDEAIGPLARNLATGNIGVHFNGPTPVLGKVLNGLFFDGVNDYVESPSTIVTNFGPAGTPGCGGVYSTCAGHFTIDTWVFIPFFPPPPTGVTVIVDKRVGSPPAIFGYSFFLYYNGSTFQLGLQLADGLAAPGFSNYFSPPILFANFVGNWHHVAVTVRRQLTNGIRWFYDGANLGSPGDPTSRPGSLLNNSPLRIGTRTAAAPFSGWFFGVLDELEIFNRALTAGEIAAIFNADSSGKCKP